MELVICVVGLPWRMVPNYIHHEGEPKWTCRWPSAGDTSDHQASVLFFDLPEIPQLSSNKTIFVCAFSMSMTKIVWMQPNSEDINFQYCGMVQVLWTNQKLCEKAFVQMF